jgi:YcaO-like protein with predicted kinase domain
MRLENATRNEYGKTDLPGNTVRRILGSLERIGVHPQWVIRCRIWEHLYWSQITSPEVALRANGKGLYAETSSASALGEFVERMAFLPQWASLCSMDEPREPGQQAARYAWLPGYVHDRGGALGTERVQVEELVGSQRVYRDAADIGALEGSDLCEDWVDGFSLVTGRTRKVPLRLVDWLSGTNGIASGNTLAEAVLQATMELIERHCALDTVLHRRIAPTISPASVTSDLLSRVLEYLRSLELDVVLKDLSGGRGFPCVGIVLTNRRLPVDHLERGLCFFGASLNPEEALARCLTEAMQGRIVNAAARRLVIRPEFHRLRQGSADNAHLLLGFGIPPEDPSFLEEGPEVPMPAGVPGDLFAEIARIQELCRQLGSDWIAVDLTNPVVDVPVVRVIMPGLLTKVSSFDPDALERRRRVLRSYFGRRP